MTISSARRVRHRDRGPSDTLRRFAADRSGNVAMIFGFSLIVLLLAIGAAVDVGRWLHARDQTVGAVDAAVLAGGRSLQKNPGDQTAAIAAAEKFYQQNVTSRLGVTDDTIDFHVSDSGKSLTATGSAKIATPFLGFAGISSLPLVSTSTVEFSKAELAVGGNGGENLEIAVMLDVTGSMGGQKLQDLKDAAKNLVDIIIRDEVSEYTAKIALVPFSEDIRLPTSALDKARGTGLASCKQLSNGNASSCSGGGGGGFGGFFSSKYYLSACVVERAGNNKYTDVAPGSGNYVMAHYVSSQSGTCTIPSSGEVVPLSTDKDALKAKIDSLQAGGWTAGQLGTAWAWYTLSPSWASLWSSGSQPAAYGSLKKIAILMTDGEYNTEYDKNGVKVGQWGAGAAVNGTSTTQARALCTAMKAKGIEIYTVGFDLGGNQTAIQTMNECATDAEKVYTADDGEQLKQAYEDIAIKLSSLFLSK